ncbi:hypothetical protein [Massilia psychrophila]|nr:hypothetical protein [Massilia psychrophila]GGE76640.1 hypothetical protein GCM10008020_21720 [Massilia psychrophila]
MHMRQKRDTPSKRVQFTALLVLVAATATIFGCRGEKPAAPAMASVTPATPVAPVAKVRTRQQAMEALMALPELKAWSSRIEKSSGGALRSALVEYDPQPRLIKGKRYFQLSFVENGSDAARRWESFLVPETGDDILVDDAATDKTLTLAQWRAATKPMERAGAN